MTLPPRALPLLETVTVGFPFSVFKVLFGLWCAHAFAVPGAVLLLLGVLDAGFNLVNLASLAVAGRRAVAVCSVSWALQRLRPGGRTEALGTALDTLLAFSLVAAAVGAGLLPHFDPQALSVWNVAVVINVLGAGLSRLASALEA
jgi:hypothetical protein